MIKVIEHSISELSDYKELEGYLNSGWEIKGYSTDSDIASCVLLTKDYLDEA